MTPNEFYLKAAIHIASAMAGNLSQSECKSQWKKINDTAALMAHDLTWRVSCTWVETDDLYSAFGKLWDVDAQEPPRTAENSRRIDDM